MKQLREAAMLLMSRRKRLQKTCPICGKIFVGLKKRRYCSTKCRVAAYRRRKAQEKRDNQEAITVHQSLFQIPIGISSNLATALNINPQQLQTSLLGTITTQWQEELPTLVTQTCPKCKKENKNRSALLILFFACDCGEVWTQCVEISLDVRNVPILDKLLNIDKIATAVSSLIKQQIQPIDKSKNKILSLK